jgi:hypothetical protein
MMETRRLLENGATNAERALLDSARDDGPGEGASRRVLIALQGSTEAGAGALHAVREAPGQAGASAGGSWAAPAVKAGVLAKVGLVSLVGLGLLGGGALVRRLAGQPSVAPDTAAARAPAIPSERAAESASLPGVGASPVSATGAVVVPPTGPGDALHGRGASPPDQSLSAEIRLLDVARTAVDARNPAAAGRALDGYGRRFPQGRLRLEATVLRLAVLVQQGEGVAARSLAARLLANPSYRAYEQRIRSLLREAGGQQADD